jgi:hypothetical protein
LTNLYTQRQLMRQQQAQVYIEVHLP